MQRLFLALSLAVSAAACSAGGDTTLTADAVEGGWPFTVQEVRLQCGDAMSMFVIADGKAYPLNGEAERRPQHFKGKEPLHPLNEIWRTDLEVSQLFPDARVSLEPLTRVAMERCK